MNINKIKTFTTKKENDDLLTWTEILKEKYKQKENLDRCFNSDFIHVLIKFIHMNEMYINYSYNPYYKNISISRDQICVFLPMFLHAKAKLQFQELKK